LDLPGLEDKIVELEKEALAPNLWDDPEKAQSITSDLSHKQAQIKKMSSVESRLDDLEVLIELAEEAADEDSAKEAVKELEALEKYIQALEVETMLSGEYDQYPAVL